MNILKFEDIPYGSTFMEVGNGFSRTRKFIKVQDVLPSGLVSKNYRQAVNKDGSLSELMVFNAVDLDTGCTATCPDWLEFEVEKLTHFPLVKNQGKF